MRKIIKKFKPFICLIICIAVCLAFVCTAFKKSGTEKVEAEESVITIWQIDSFEGGKGSRADFLQKIGEDFADNGGCYVSVITLSSDALRLNLKNGITPDLISYGAGTYGIESYINSFTSWCHGGYCLLTIEGDFSDVNAENTILNEGKDNFTGAAALFFGLQGAASEKATGAYVKLINGGFKYLLGTQRDIYRLKTRGVSFKVQPLTQFNDLYQNISVTSDCKHSYYANKYVKYLLSRTAEVSKLGLLSDGVTFDDEMNIMQGLNYDYKLTSPVSEQTYKSINDAISVADINILKNLLK